MSDTKTLWCRNCREFVRHERIGVKQDGWTGEHKGLLGWLFGHLKFEPVYACHICRCETTDPHRALN